jgi:hypothetical protein
MREALKDGVTPYYKYLVVYVHDILCISEQPRITMKAIAKLYHLKNNKVVKPKTYFGAQVIEYMLPDGKIEPRWGLSSYVTLKKQPKM